MTTMSLACGFNIAHTPTSTTAFTNTPTITFTPTKTFTPTITFTPTLTFTPTPFYEVKTIGELTMQAGGFSIPDLTTYEVNDYAASVYYYSLDNYVQAKVYSFVSYDASNPLAVLREKVDELKKDYDDLQATDAVTERLDSYEITSMDFTGTRYDEAAQGRLAVIAPPGSKPIYFFIVAIGDQRWDREGSKVYQTLLDGLSVFPVEAANRCRISSSPSYGFQAGAFIPIGGGLREGGQRITDYLDTLLGPNGEFIAFRREGIEPYGSVNLEKYSILFGGLTQTLYFNIYASSDLSAPNGMQCSAPLPARLP